jgi:hypothetical protein
MWHRHRSAPLGVLLAGALVLLATGTTAAVFYLSVVRRARGLPAYTAGLQSARVIRALPGVAAYRVHLAGPAERTTPAGTPSAAHRWRITVRAAPDDPLCEGVALDALTVWDDSGARPLALPLPASLFIPGETHTVPPRLLAVCAGSLASVSPAALVYSEEVVVPGTPIEIAACLHRSPPGSLGPCADGTPARIYPRPPASLARARTREAMHQVAGCAGVFALVCFVTGLAALRRFDRTREPL